MKYLPWLTVVLATGMSVAACSSDDDSSPPASGGASGKAGSPSSAGAPAGGASRGGAPGAAGADSAGAGAGGTAGASGALSAGAGGTAGGEVQEKDIIDTAVAAGSFSKLAAALTKAGLVDALKGDGPFTVFAPDDAAFDAFESANPGVLAGLSKDALTTILTYHVVAGAAVES